MKVGITGGIGSGKTTVAHIFKWFGIPVYDSDLRAKKLMNANTALIDQIKARFGNEVYINNQLQRQALGKIVFNDPKALNDLNHIVHPAVGADYALWAKQITAPYSIKEAAILFESGAYKQVDKVIVVSASKELRIERVIKRDGVNRASVEKRMASQWSEQQRLENADYVIHNENDQSLLLQVQKVHLTLLALTANR